MDLRIPRTPNWFANLYQFLSNFSPDPTSFSPGSMEDPAWMVQQLIQANPSGMIVVDAQKPDLPIIYVNDAFERITGYKLHEVIGRNCRFLQNDDHDQPDIEIIREALHNQEPCVAILRNYRKDGSMFWNELRIAPIWNRQGMVTHFVGIQNDITARKETEEEVERSNRLYRQIFEDNHAIKLLIDPQTGRIMEANSAAASFYGYTLAELRQMHIQQINVRNDEEVMADMQRALQRDRIVFHFEHRLASGEVRDVEVFSGPVDTLNGRYLYSIIVDITERREAEIRYRALFEQSTDAVFILDLEGNHIEVNRRGAEMLGYTPEEVIGLSFRDVVVPDEQDKSQNVLQKLLNGEQVPPYERVFRRKDGSQFIGEVNVEIVFDSGGKPLHMQSLVRDISERNQMIQALAESEGRFRGAIEASLDAFYLMESVRDENGEIVDFRILEINEEAVLQMQMPREELVGGLICEKFPINRENGFCEDYKRVVETGEPLEQEFCIPKGYPSPGWYYHQVVKVGDGVAIVNSDISKRKQMEADLNEKYAELDRFFTVALDLLAIADKDGNFVKVNKAWETILGYSAKELEGKQFLDFIHPDDIPPTLDAMEQLNQQEQVIGFTNRYRSSTGDYRYIEWRSHPYGDLVYAAARDITERKRMEDELRESEQRFRSFVEYSGDGIAMIDEDGRIIQWNESMAKLTEMPAEEALGQYMWDVQYQVAPKSSRSVPSYEQLKAMFRNLLATGESPWLYVPHESLIEGSSGRRIMVQSVMFPIPTGKGYQFGSIMRDIGEQKRMEEALRESEANLRAVIEAIPDTIFRSRADGTYLDWYNSDQEALLQQADDSLQNQLTGILPPEVIEAHTKAVRKALNTGYVIGHEFQIPLADDTRYFEMRVVPSGEEEVVSILRDVTEQYQIRQRELELALERERRQLLTAFIRDAAHEFRTPLANIGTSAYLLSRMEDMAKREEKVQRINEQIQSILQLVEMLTLMVKVEKPDTLEKTAVNLVALVQYVVRERLERYGKHRVIHTELDGATPDIPGNVVLLTTAITQIIDNALRFTTDEDEINVTLQIAADSIVLQVTDTGDGLTPDELSRAFESFWRKDSAHTTQGFGIGLPIAQKIIQLHGGEIRLESEPGQGTTATIRFPLLPLLSTMASS